MCYVRRPDVSSRLSSLSITCTEGASGDERQTLSGFHMKIHFSFLESMKSMSVHSLVPCTATPRATSSPVLPASFPLSLIFKAEGHIVHQFLQSCFGQIRLFEIKFERCFTTWFIVFMVQSG